MNNKNDVTFLSAFGATGSSAVVDLIKEVKSYYVFESEFRLFVDPGGLINLRNALVDNWSIFQTDIAIKNFKKIVKSINRKGFGSYSILSHQRYLDDKFIKRTNEYIEEITELEYRGLWYGDDSLIMRQLNKYRLFHRNKFLMKPIYVGKILEENEFNKITESYIRSLINYCLKKHNKNNFCFNENFASLFPFKILDMVPNSKMLVVIRDPKDVLADTMRVRWIAAPIRVDQFIQWESMIYNKWMKIEDELKEKSLYNKNIKLIRFEDLIIKYDTTVDKIFKFLGIKKSDHILKKKYLDPEISIKNVGQWKGMLLESDAEKIETEFKEFYNRYNYH